VTVGVPPGAFGLPSGVSVGPVGETVMAEAETDGTWSARGFGEEVTPSHSTTVVTPNTKNAALQIRLRAIFSLKPCPTMGRA
jgi:hypothetical protein